MRREIEAALDSQRNIVADVSGLRLRDTCHCKSAYWQIGGT